MPQKKTLQVFGSCSKTEEQLLIHFADRETEWFNDVTGGWSLAYTDEERIVLATDRWGTRPLFYAVNNQTGLFSENIDDIMKRLPVLTCNEQALARFLLEDFSHPEDTVFNEINKVPQGSVITIEKNQIQSLQWARQTWTVKQNDFSHAVGEWNRALTQHLTALLPQHKKWGIFVSGGLDSAGLVALSVHLIRQHQWPVTLELYNLTSPDPESSDQGFCQKMAQEYKIPLHQICVTPEDLEKLYCQWHAAKTGLPYFATLQMFEPLMVLAKQNQCTGLLFGYGADEQWTLPSETLAIDFLTQTNWSLLLKNKDSSESFKTYVLSLLKLWARLKIPEPIKSAIHRWRSRGIPWHLHNRVIFQEQRKQLKKRIQAVENNFVSNSQKQLYLRNFISGNNQHNLACHITMAQAHDLKVYFPYLSPELLDISLASSPELLFLAKDKRVLRELLKGFLLEEVRTAPKFQDYSQLAHKTALQLAQPTTNFSCLQKWIRPNIELIKFDNDSYFEMLYVEKLMQVYGAGYEKKEEAVSKTEA